MNAPLLSVHDLSYALADHLLFAPVSFALSEGDICQVLGSNGVGKTTLLRMLCGLLQPTVGKIFWRDGAAFIYVGHLSGLKSRLTVRENLEFMAMNLGVHLTDEHIQDFLTTLGLLAWRNVAIGRLSAGQKRRLALARLLMRSVKLWILDEPFHALDADAQVLLMKLCMQHVKAGGAMIFTSHHIVHFDRTYVRQITLDKAYVQVE